MNSMKKIIILIIGVYLICFTFSCRKKDKDDCPYCPKIDGISPTSGKKGDTIIISGRNFSSVLLENIVTFNGVTVSPTSMISGSTTQLKVLVPPKCGTGSVEVKLDDELYSENGPIFTYNPQTIVTTIAGGISGSTVDGILIAAARFKGPSQLAIDGTGDLYVLDTGDLKITKLKFSAGGYTDVLIDNSSQVTNPTAFTVDQNNVLYVSNYYAPSFTGTATIFQLTPGSKNPISFMSDPTSGKKHISMVAEAPGKFYIGRATTNLSVELYDIVHYSTNGFQNYTSGAGCVIYLKNDYIHQINSLVAQKIYMTEYSKYHVSDTVETSILDKTAGLNFSRGLVVDDAGNAYIADTQNNRIIKCSPAGVVTPLVTTGLKLPQGMVLDRFGNIYVADTGNHSIKKITFD